MTLPFTDITAIALAGQGTVFDQHAAVAHEAAALGAAAPTLPALWQAKCFEYAMLGALAGRHADFWTITGEALDHAMAMHGIGDPLLRTRLMQAVLQAPLFPDVAPALAALHALGRKLLLLTNASPIMAIAQAKACGLFTTFDALLSTEPSGAVKPQPAAYALAPKQVNAQPHQVLFVSANAWDVAGAAQAGLTAVWLNRASVAPEYAWAPRAAAIGSLAELPTLLPAAQAAA